jgi:hypothetical protein
MNPTFWATTIGVIVATSTIIVSYIGLKRQLKQNFAIGGSQASIAWREQVFGLHDRGLTPDAIRYIMYLEHAGKGYEQEYGPIDEVVRNVPRRVPTGLLALPTGSPPGTAPKPNLPVWNGE